MEHEVERKIFLRDFKILSRELSTHEDLPSLFDRIADIVIRAFKVKGCSILLLDERDKQFFRVTRRGVSEEYCKKGPVLLDEKQMLAEGKPVFVKDMQNDPSVQYPEAARKEGIASMLSIPICFRNTHLGILRIYHSEPWELHEDDLDSFCILGLHLGLVIEYNGIMNFFETVKWGLQRLPARLLKDE
jgi:signal transduction protein with GAF and PtsI domain